MKDWKNYYKHHKNRSPRPQLLEAISLCPKKDNALDLGAAPFIESKALSKAGFKVIAIDNSPDAIEYQPKNPRVTFKNLSFTEYKFPKNHFDLVNAELSISFGGEKFHHVLNEAFNSLKNGGIFTGSLLGNKDDYNRLSPEIYCISKTTFFRKFSRNLIFFKEEEIAKRTASGDMKHWHVFRFMIKKTLEHQSSVNL